MIHFAGVASSSPMTRHEDSGTDADDVATLPMSGLSSDDADMVRREIERQERAGGAFRVGGYGWDD